MALPLPTLDRVHRTHAKQLASFQIDHTMFPPDDELPWNEEVITDWVKDNIQAIRAAQASRELLVNQCCSCTDTTHRMS